MTRCPIRKDFPQCSVNCAFYIEDDEFCAITAIAISLGNVEIDTSQISNTLALSKQ